MSERVSYEPFLYTGHLVDYLKSCPDQVASSEDIYEHFVAVPFCTIRETIARLNRNCAHLGYDRVAEIAPDLWHLE